MLDLNVRKLVSACLLLPGTFLSQSRPAMALEIEVIDPLPEFPGQYAIVLSGEFEPGDHSAFLSAIDGKPKATISLASPGGVIREALAIGAEINLRNYATMVLPEQECQSACALVWLSGARRYMSLDSVIGFHAAYLQTEDGELRESGMANAEIGSYLTHLGYNKHLIRFATVTGPTDTLQLRPDQARALGVEIFLQEGTSVRTPGDLPTVPALVERFLSLSTLLGFCSEWMKLDVPLVENGLTALHEEGVALAGQDLWLDYFLTEVERSKHLRQSFSMPELCIQSEDLVQGAGIDIGLIGPSFDCSRASTDTEHGICDHKSLWARDQVSSALYYWIRQADHDGFIQQNQREWLRGRDSCGYNEGCLIQSYNGRIEIFGSAREGK